MTDNKNNGLTANKIIRSDCHEVTAAAANCDVELQKSDRALVFVATDMLIMGEQICAILAQAGFEPRMVGGGQELLAMLVNLTPSAVVLDVGLSGVMAFEIVETLRSDPKSKAVKVILIASVFNKTAYKRRPASLYGADDYVEQHHISDYLPARLAALLGVALDNAGVPRRAVIDPSLEAGDARQDLIGEDRVCALARKIVSDVALYHEAEVRAAASGVISPRLKKALDEAKIILKHKLGDELDTKKDPIQLEFAALLAQMRC